MGQVASCACARPKSGDYERMERAVYGEPTPRGRTTYRCCGELWAAVETEVEAEVVIRDAEGATVFRLDGTLPRLITDSLPGSLPGRLLLRSAAGQPLALLSAQSSLLGTSFSLLTFAPNWEGQRCEGRHRGAPLYPYACIESSPIPGLQRLVLMKRFAKDNGRVGLSTP